MLRTVGSTGCALTSLLVTLALGGCLEANPDFDPGTPSPGPDARAVVPPSRDAGASPPEAEPPPLDALAPPDGSAPAPPDLMAPDLTRSPDLPPDTGPLCATGEQAFAGHCYRVLQGPPMTYAEARQACKAQGALPVSIGSGAEQAAVFGFIPKNLQVVWIGLLRGDDGKSFVWESGEPLSYTNWAPGEPNNAGWQEDCGEIWGPAISNAALAGGWNDDNCASRRGAVICERVP